MQKFVQSRSRAATAKTAGTVTTYCLLVAVPGLSLLPFGGEAHCDPLTSPWTLGAKSSVRLISGAPSRPFYSAGVEIRLDPGALTYWRTPGDAGAPPVFSFEGSDNVANVTILYPAPKRIDEAGTEAFGYSGEVTFPLHVSPKDETRPVNLALKMNYAVCERICLPSVAEAKLTLPPAIEAPGVTGVDSPVAIAAAEARVPVRLSPGERDKKISIIRDPGAAKPTWRLKIAKDDAKDDSRSQDAGVEDLFAEAPEGWYYETRKSDRPNEFLIVEAERPRTETSVAAPVLLTLTRPGRSYEFTVELQPATNQH